jgi:hypothetical protein
VFTEVDHASPTDIALAAGAGVLLDDDPVAEAQTMYAFAHFHDGAGIFVAEYDRG